MSKDMLGPAVKKLVALPSNALGTATDLLGKMANPSWLDAVKGFLRKEEIVWRQFLRSMGEITLPASTGSYDPEVCFRTRPGLCIEDSFRRILMHAYPTKDSPKTTLSAFDIIKVASNAEIRSELPEGHVFEEPDGKTGKFCATLRQMILWQSNGGENNLLNNGYCNIFYVLAGSEVYVASIYRLVRNRMWGVGADLLDDSRWGGGDRVFSCNR